MVDYEFSFRTVRVTTPKKEKKAKLQEKERENEMPLNVQ